MKPTSMDRIAILLAMIIMLSFSIRLYPTLLTGLPFSTDSWPLISNTENLLELTPISLEDRAFDGYNNYWPASQIFGAVSSIILDAKVLDVERLLFPAAASLAVIPFYVVVRKTTGSRISATISSLLLALGSYQAIFTSGVTKETFTLALFFTYLALAFMTGSTVERKILLFIAGAAIVMGHHLQYFLLLAILLNMLILRFFLRRVDDESFTDSLTPLVPLLIVGSIYYPLYALRGITFSLTTSDILSLISFQVLSYLLQYYLLTGAVKPPIKLFIIWAASYMVLAANQFFPVMPASPRIPASLSIQLSIIFMLGVFTIIGLDSLKRRGSVVKMYHVVGWLSALLFLEAYSMFGAQPSMSLGLFYRIANHILPPVSILSSIGLVKIMDLFKSKRVGVVCLTIILLPISLTMVYQHYSSTILQENYLGYQWMYSMAEYELASWLSRNIDNVRVCGDMKVSYLLEGYFKVKVDVGGGFKILNDGAVSGETLLIIYRVMEKNGYVLGLYGVKLRDHWAGNIVERADKIFSNILTEAYRLL